MGRGAQMSRTGVIAKEELGKYEEIAIPCIRYLQVSRHLDTIELSKRRSVRECYYVEQVHG